MFVAPVAHADLPSAEVLLTRVGLSASEAEKMKAGEIVQVSLEPGHERELATGFVFLVKGMTPTELIQLGRQGENDQVDPNTLAVQLITDAPTAEDFSKLVLRPDADAQAKAFLGANAGGGLNLSLDEITAFQKLGSDASPAQVEAQLRTMLFARLQAYRQKGLAGIMPYARGTNETRSPAEDLRSAIQKQTLIKESLPSAYQHILDYPKGRPADTDEVFRWLQIEANGESALVLTHNLYVPDGDAWVVVQRHFYVSAGYNCLQATAAFVPVKDGTAVFYGNRTSTDQVSGFGGGAKRSIGSKLLSSQLEELFESVREKAGAANP